MITESKNWEAGLEMRLPNPFSGSPHSSLGLKLEKENETAMLSRTFHQLEKKMYQIHGNGREAGLFPCIVNGREAGKGERLGTCSK